MTPPHLPKPLSAPLTGPSPTGPCPTGPCPTMPRFAGRPTTGPRLSDRLCGGALMTVSVRTQPPPSGLARPMPLGPADQRPPTTLHPAVCR